MVVEFHEIHIASHRIQAIWRQNLWVVVRPSQGGPKKQGPRSCAYHEKWPLLGPNIHLMSFLGKGPKGRGAYKKGYPFFSPDFPKWKLSFFLVSLSSAAANKHQQLDAHTVRPLFSQTFISSLISGSRPTALFEYRVCCIFLRAAISHSKFYVIVFFCSYDFDSKFELPTGAMQGSRSEWCGGRGACFVGACLRGKEWKRRRLNEHHL